MTAELAATSQWPLFNLHLLRDDVSLQALREDDAAELAALLPADAEHNPQALFFKGLDLEANRRQWLLRSYWLSGGTWSVERWELLFGIRWRGQLVGLQSLEADNFVSLRTVDSSSWLVAHQRGAGIGTMARCAVLSLAFDHLAAHAAISSARADNAASLAVSHKIGYRANGVSTIMSPSGPCELLHLRLLRSEWLSSGLGNGVTIDGLDACGPYFGIDLSESTP